MLILGIESSCDETAAAVIEDDKTILSNIINSQIDIHALYGGIVPELASRQHIRNIYYVVNASLEQAGVSLDQIDCIAVTEGPGLIGCLLVGHTFAKAVSLVRNIPMTGVDHLSGHLLSVHLGDRKPEFPYIAMIASGGHSSLFLVEDFASIKLLGRTRDDAAGEAFDKVAKLLKLGYPGGPIISELSNKGNPEKISFPRAWLDKDSLDFSFSGLKTAVVNHVNNSQINFETDIPDICASFQEAVVDVIVSKTINAAKINNCENIVLGGGVAANPRLREELKDMGAAAGFNVFLTPLQYCTDNAAMIALTGYKQLKNNGRICPDTDVYSRSTFK